MKRSAVREHVVVPPAVTNFASREGQRVAQLVRASQASALCRNPGHWCATNVLGFRQVAGG